MKSSEGKLLNDIFIKEISSIIKTIDEQIIDLHQCSSDDFLGLYSDFKDYYNQSKGISENANEIFESLSEESNRNLFIELQSLYKDLKKIQSQSNLNLNSSTRSLKNIHSFLNQFFIPIKNLKQNLSTLRFLLANLTLNDFQNITEIDKKWIDLFKENNLIITEYHERCVNCEKYIFSLEAEIILAIKRFESVLIANSNNLESVLNNIHYGIIFFAEKHEEVKHQIPELTTKTDNSSQNIADIITSLQYQDIIKQKIEHIQLSHKSILDEFDLLNELRTSDSKKQSQLLQKIKDISSLQAAILVKANKEYQLAIEKITEKFIEIGNDMISITSICKRLNSSQDNSDEIHLTLMLQKLNTSEQVFTNFIETTKEHSVQIEHLNELLLKFFNISNSLIDSNLKFSSSTESIISSFSYKANDDQCIKETITQIKVVIADIHHFEKTIQAVLDSILKNENELTNEVKLFVESIVKNQTVNNAAESIKSILDQLQVKSDHINHLLEENILQSNRTISDIKESIKRIRYYDLFEKTITNIIEELNEIHKKVKNTDTDETVRDEYLNSIKDSYTMETEHLIHNRIVLKDEKDTLNDAQGLEDKEINKNSDEVELF